MKESLMKGCSFGLVSGVITTLGLMIGLNSSTHSTTIVIGGVLVIAIADAFSDALGIHISEEAEMKHTPKQIWAATISTLISKFLIALTFLIPLLLFYLDRAIIVSLIWGFSLIVGLSIYLAKKQKLKAYKVILEHVVIAAIVVLVTHYVGGWITSVFV